MKTVHYLGILVFLVIVLSQPFFSSLFIQDQIWINTIAVLGYIALVYPVFLLYKQLIKKLTYRIDQLSKNHLESKAEINKLHDLTKNDFIYYKHTKDTPFDEISPSVFDILNITPDNFRKFYKIYKADVLYQGVFDRVLEYEKNGMRVPQYEVELKTQKGRLLTFEVIEIPIFDEDKELIGVWGTLRYIRHNKTDFNLKQYNSEDKFNLLLDNINDGIMLLKGDRFVDCNTKALDIFETSLDQMIMYSPFSSKYSPITQPSGKNSKDDALKRIHLAYDGKPQMFEWVHLKPSGEPFNVKIKLFKYEHENEVYLLVIMQDISSEYRLSHLVNKKSQLVDLLFMHSSIAMLEFNLDKEIIDFNLAFSKLFGLGKEIIRKKVNQILINDELDILLQTSKRKNEEFIEIRLDKQNEQSIFSIKIVSTAEDNSNKGGIMLIEEINDVKKLEIDLSIQENNFNEIIKKSNDVLYKYDLVNRRYIYVSQSVENIFEYSPAEFKSMSDAELKSILHPKEYNRAHIIIAKLFDGKLTKKERQLEYRIINKSGVVKWIRDSYSIILDNNGTPKAILGVISDLTEQKKNLLFIDKKDKLLEIMIENINQGMTVVIDNKIEYVNSKLLEMTAYTKEELNDVEALFLFATESDKMRLKDEYIDIIAGNSKTNELSYWLVKKTGETIFIKNEYYIDRDNPQNRYILTTDITEEKHRGL